MSTQPEAGGAAPRQEPPTSLSSRVTILLILAATLVAYLGTLTFAFVYDDHQQIVLNPVLRAWRFVPYYFIHDVWSQRSILEVSNYYRPIFLLWLRVNDALFGLKPAGWHAAALALHLLTTWLVYRLAIRLLQNRWQAGFAAAFFGLDPIHLEAVAWVSGANEPLMAALLIAAFLCYLNFRDAGSKRVTWLAAGTLLFFLAVLAKETAIVLPALIFAYAWIYAGESKAGIARRVKEGVVASLPFGLAAILYLAVRVSVLGAVGRAMTQVPWHVVMFTWPSILWFYIRLLVWPAGLSVFYDTPYVTQPTFGNFVAPLAGVIVVAAILMAWSFRSRVAAFAMIWLVLPILPVLDFRVFGRGDIAHDRYLYLPSVGLAILAGLIVSRVPSLGKRLLGQPAGAILASAAILGAFAVGTVWQSAYWANDIVLCYHGMNVAPRNSYARNTLGVAMMNKRQWAKAIELFKQAIERDSSYMDPYSNLALLYYKTGNYSRSQDFARLALRLDDGDSGTWFVLGVDQLGLGNYPRAEAIIRHAIALEPRAFGFHYGLGVTLRKAGNLQGALAEFKAEPADSPKAAAAREQIDQIESLIRSGKNQ